MYNRKGALLREGFQRKRIDSDEYMRDVICYIHNNPVVHGFVQEPGEWRYSSFKTIFDSKPSFVCNEEVIDLFDSKDNLKYVHKQRLGRELE